MENGREDARRWREEEGVRLERRSIGEERGRWRKTETFVLSL